MIIITIDNEISINKGSLPDAVTKDIRDQLTFINPQYVKNQKYNRSNQNTPEYLNYLKKKGNNLIIPRGFIYQLIGILKNYNVDYKIINKTRKLPQVDFYFKGKLYDYQQVAVEKIISKRFSVLQSPTGSGKTVIACDVIAKQKQPALIIVHTKELLYQWQARIEQFLGISKDKIGLIGDSNKTIGTKITIAIINSLKKCIDEVKDRIGFLIVDECHRTPSKVFSDAVKVFDCGYMLGLSATPYRNDGLTKLIYFHVGDKVHYISATELQKTNMIMTATLKKRDTNFDFPYNDNYPEMLNNLIRDCDRNELIVNDVIEAIQNGSGIGLILSDSKDHCKKLYQMLADRDIETSLLTGDIAPKKRKTIVAELSHGHIKALVVTSQLIGEGFDLKHLSSIFLCTPMSSAGRLTQCIGRILRIAEGKNKAVVYDYVDKNVGVLDYSFWSRRCDTYKELGIKTPNLMEITLTVGSGRVS